MSLTPNSPSKSPGLGCLVVIIKKEKIDKLTKKLQEQIVQLAKEVRGHEELMEQLSIDFNNTLERIDTIKANNRDGKGPCTPAKR